MGLFFGLFLAVHNLWITLLSGLICGILWALSGAGYSKLFRRLGCPFVLLLGHVLFYKSFIPFVSLLPIFGVLSLGYGIPSTQPPDEGSTLGRFFYKLTKKDEFLANILTRLTIFLLVVFSLVPLVFIPGYSVRDFVFNGVCYVTGSLTCFT